MDKSLKKRWTLFKKLISLIRPINSTLVGFAVIVGIAVSSLDNIIRIATPLGFLTGFFISSYSMIINDYYDIEVDRINNPKKPLPSGEISKKTAVQFASIMLICGLLTSALVNNTTLFIAIIFAIIAWIYNSWGKKKALLGNSMVALSVAIPYLYGGVSIQTMNTPLILCLTLTSFSAALGREIIKTISDTEGDKQKEINSISVIYGERSSSIIGSIFFIIAIITSIVPYILDMVKVTYVILVTPSIILFIFSSIIIIKDYSKENSIRVKKINLLAMFLGLIAFIIGPNL